MLPMIKTSLFKPSVRFDDNFNDF